MTPAETSHANLCAAHERFAIRNACSLDNYGWVVDDDVICSKTNRGYLTTRRVASRKYTHKLQNYDFWVQK